MTDAGGDNGLGVIFKIDTDGSDFELLREFAGGSSDGSEPSGSLILNGSTLYGMTDAGGDNGLGVVFKIDTDGSNFTLLHEFGGGGDDGSEPGSGLILNGSTLYGMTETGGDSDLGVIFKIDTDGSSFGILHEFAGGGNDGSEPRGSLILNGSTLYSMTRYGGDTNVGVIFKIDTDGSSFGLLHEFAGGGSDGSEPRGSLILSGSTLYGMTRYGGDTNVGVIFKIDTDGSDFTLLHEFAGGGSDGSEPRGSLILSGFTLYGMTRYGGDTNVGALFKVDTDGSDYTILHEFAGGGNDGSEPRGSLTLNNVSLLGMSEIGGDSNLGVIFSYHDSALPVELTSFTSEYINNMIVLEWTTESLAGGLGFIIERRTGGSSDWLQIASYLTDDNLVCMNNPIGQAQYSHTDDNIEANTQYSYRLSNADIFGNVSVLDVIENVSTRVVKDSPGVLPEKTALLAAYPNPFNPQTTIAYQLPEDKKVTIRVYNLMGEQINELVNGYKQAGYLEVVWDGKDFQNKDVNSGIYLIKMQARDYFAVKKATLLR